jgi:hypothetical protein
MYLATTDMVLLLVQVTPPMVLTVLMCIWYATRP